MSAPITAKPILAPAELAILEQAKRGYGASSALKSGGRGSAEKNVFLKSVSKLLMLLALSCFQDPTHSTAYDFAQTKPEAAKMTIFESLFKKMCIHLLVPENELPENIRVMGMGSIRFQKFWKDYVLGQLITEYGGDSEKGIELMTIMCQSIKPDGKEFRFNEWSGKSIKSLGDNTIAEVKRLEKDFSEKILDPNGKPKSGKTWDVALNEYRQVLFDEEKKKKPTKQSTTEDAQNDEEALQDVLDPFDKFGESSLNMSDGWLPGGDHAWLAFVCYGPYGQAVFDTDRPYVLQSHTAASSDAVKTGRRENKESASKLVAAENVADKFVDKLVNTQIRQNALHEFEQLWGDKSLELETKIKSAKDMMMSELDCLKFFQQGTEMYDMHFREYLDRKTKYEVLIGKRDMLASEKAKLRKELLPKLIDNESKPSKKMRDMPNSNEYSPVHLHFGEEEDDAL